MRNKYFLTVITCLAATFLMYMLTNVFSKNYTSKIVKAGFVYIGDASTAYTNNFYRAQKELEEQFPDNVVTVAKYNVQENDADILAALEDLVRQECNIVFSTSYGYENNLKNFAKKHPDIQFCQATGDNANIEPVLPNYHTFMGTIYEGRYISGIVAGLKLQELVNKGVVSRKHVKIGYVAAFPYAEVISGYTAFFLGVRSVIPEPGVIILQKNVQRKN